MEELQGLADGSRTDFYKLFLNMLQEEFSYVVPSNFSYSPRTHCSDYIMKTEDNAYIVHNEDGSGMMDFNHTILVKESIYIGRVFWAVTPRWEAGVALHRLHIRCSDPHRR